jgi:hypothetical protein
VNARRLLVLLVAVVSAGSLHNSVLRGQSYTSGQPVWPAFEGWEKNDDGSLSFVFGYMNDNWQQELDVPVGPDNTIDPGGPDRGQPTRFQPRRNRFVFKVRVPKDWGDKELIWTLTTQGVARKAFASLRTDLLIENIDIMSESGALGAGTSSPEQRADKPPVIAIASKTLTAKVGQPLELTATVTDDGVPRRRGGGAPARGIRRHSPPSTAGTCHRRQSAGPASLVVSYWGPASVTFTRQIKVWEDTRTGASSPWAPSGRRRPCRRRQLRHHCHIHRAGHACPSRAGRRRPVDDG